MTSELVGLSATMLMPKGVVPPTTPCRRVVCVPKVEVVGGSPPGVVGGSPPGVVDCPVGVVVGVRVLAISPDCAVSTWASSSALAYCR